MGCGRRGVKGRDDTRRVERRMLTLMILIVTIYTEQGCKDPGVVMGVGGYFSDGEKGLKGYRVDCPWW